jgi:hypothetical protein
MKKILAFSQQKPECLALCLDQAFIHVLGKGYGSAYYPQHGDMQVHFQRHIDRTYATSNGIYEDEYVGERNFKAVHLSTDTPPTLTDFTNLLSFLHNPSTEQDRQNAIYTIWTNPLKRAPHSIFLSSQGKNPYRFDSDPLTEPDRSKILDSLQENAKLHTKQQIKNEISVQGADKNTRYLAYCIFLELLDPTIESVSYNCTSFNKK